MPSSGARPKWRASSATWAAIDVLGTWEGSTEELVPVGEATCGGVRVGGGDGGVAGNDLALSGARSADASPMVTDCTKVALHLFFVFPSLRSHRPFMRWPGSGSQCSQQLSGT